MCCFWKQLEVAGMDVMEGLIIITGSLLDDRMRKNVCARKFLVCHAVPKSVRAIFDDDDNAAYGQPVEADRNQHERRHGARNAATVAAVPHWQPALKTNSQSAIISDRSQKPKNPPKKLH
jgi:hypothetical protein